MRLCQAIKKHPWVDNGQLGSIQDEQLPAYFTDTGGKRVGMLEITNHNYYRKVSLLIMKSLKETAFQAQQKYSFYFGFPTACQVTENCTI